MRITAGSANKVETIGDKDKTLYQDVIRASKSFNEF